MTTLPYWRFAGFYFFYFAFVGAFSPYWSLYLKSLSLSAFQIGVLMSLLQVTRIFAPNAWGLLADRWGTPVRVIRLASVFSAIAFLGVFLGTSFVWLFFVMALMSFFWSGSLPLMEATTMSHLGEATSHYSRIRLWGSVGFVLAVIGLGALLDLIWIGWLPALVLAFMVGIIGCAYTLPEKDPIPHTAAGDSVREILHRPEVISFLAACFLMAVAHGPLYVFYSIYLVDHGYSKTAVGMLWSLGVLCEIFVFIYLPQLFDRYSLKSVLRVSFALAVLRFLLIGWAVDSVAMITLAQLLHAATFGSYHCAALALVHRYFRGRHQAKGQTLYSSISFGAGGTLGGVMSGLTWERMGPGMTFTISSACALAGFILLLRNHREQQTSA